jgi:predicted secreted protein
MPHDDHIRQLNVERSEMIERLTQANKMLGRCLGHLEADLLVETIATHVSSDTRRELIKDVRAFIRGGLFGDRA